MIKQEKGIQKNNEKFSTREMTQSEKPLPEQRKVFGATIIQHYTNTIYFQLGGRDNYFIPQFI